MKIIGNYDRKVKEFILVDSCDSDYADLIEFDTEVDLKELQDVIYKKMNNMINEYTNEDIYDAIDELGVPFSIRFLGGLERIEY